MIIRIHQVVTIQNNSYWRKIPEYALSNANVPYLEFSQLPRPLAAFFMVNAIHHGAHYGFFRVRVWINLKHKEINRPWSKVPPDGSDWLTARIEMWYTAQFRNKPSSNVPPIPVLVSSSRQSGRSTRAEIYKKTTSYSTPNNHHIPWRSKAIKCDLFRRQSSRHPVSSIWSECFNF